MSAIGHLLHFCLTLYLYIIIASAVLSWLVAFQVINISNPQAANLVKLLNRVTEPVYKPLRKFIPPIGGIDITPIVVIFAIFLMQELVARMFLYPRFMF